MRVKRYPIAFIAWFSLVAGHVWAEPPAVAPATFILAGQSNMSGRGDLAALTEADRLSDPRIRLFGNDGLWRLALDPLDDAHGQIDVVSADRLAAVGPGLFFAREFMSGSGRDVALIPCAKGGSSMQQWKPDLSANTLYGSCLGRAKAAGSPVTGIFWYQGETDARNSHDARRWSVRFKAIVKALRHDLRSPHLPVVLVELADAPSRADQEGPFVAWTDVQRAQRAVRLRCTKLVSARGLARNADDLHLTTDAQRRLGPALSQAMAALANQGCN